MFRIGSNTREDQNATIMKTKNKKTSLIVLTFSLLLACLAALTQPGRFVRKESMKLQQDTLDLGALTNDDPWRELELLVDHYYNDYEATRYVGTMRLLDDNSEKEKVLEQKDFMLEMVKDEYYYKLDSIECVSKSDFTLIVDHKEKLIAFAPIFREGRNNVFDFSALRRMMMEQNVQAKVREKNGKKILTIDSIPHPEIKGYQVYYDPLSYKVEKLLIGMSRFTSLTDAGNEEKEVGGEFGSDIENRNDINHEELNMGSISTYNYYIEIEYTRKQEFKTKSLYNPESRFVEFRNANGFEPLPEYQDYEFIKN